ncbi:MAG: hypothetical protein DRI75_10135 [Bacteroidetes bacterium]|nr:MAG: hypothetical protein DRI75_10135 [Bacteroidota bacterium]
MRLFIGFCILFLVGCQSSKNEAIAKKETVYEMYKPSEMAILMNEMYLINEKIKAQILAGEALEEFPEAYLKIHTATLTKPTDRDDFFNSFSELYIDRGREVYNASKDELVIKYNNAINTCISCHQQKCTGPIPKIQSLLIQ